MTCGLRIGVRVSEPGLLDRVLGGLPPGTKPSSSPSVERLYSIRAAAPARRNIRPFNVLYLDSEQLEKSHNLDDLLGIFRDDLELYVAEYARRRLFIHAGVVAWNGRAILFPGKSMSGKSSLVKEFVDAGAGYYSDEYAVLDSRGMVHPYRRPLSLRQEAGSPPVGAYADSADQAEALPVGLIALSRYEPDGKWRPRKLSPGSGVLALLSNSLSARRQPRFALSVLSRLATRVPILKGPRGEAFDMARALLTSPYLT